MPRFDLSQYVDVQTRINQFWKDYPDGRIVTHVLSDANVFDRIVVQAEVYKNQEHAHPDASDIAAEEKGQGGMANTTSWHENCSTSAIGRALATLGYATSLADRPSREEMDKARRGESQPSRPQPRDAASAPARPVTQGQDNAQRGAEPASTERQHRYIRALMGEKGVSDEAMHATLLVDYGEANHLYELSKKDASEYIEYLTALKPKEGHGVKQEPQKGYETNQYAVPEEPDWLPPGAGNDRHTA